MTEPNTLEYHIVFDGPPGPESCRFVEVEDANGRSFRAGEWIERPDGYWALVIRPFAGRPSPSVDAGEVERDMAGETVMGMRVAAWTWGEPLNQANLATEAADSRTMDRFATHWSTGPAHAERLFRESDVRALLDGRRSTTPTED